MTESKIDNKRLEVIKKQLMGHSTLTSSYAFTSSSKPTISSDISYLKKDLRRILILISLALAVELSLSWAIHQGLLVRVGLR